MRSISQGEPSKRDIEESEAFEMEKEETQVCVVAGCQESAQACLQQMLTNGDGRCEASARESRANSRYMFAVCCLKKS